MKTLLLFLSLLGTYLAVQNQDQDKDNISKIFKIIDKNRDRNIDNKELFLVFEKNPEVIKRSIFFDQDKNSKLDEIELENFLMACRETCLPKMLFFFGLDESIREWFCCFVCLRSCCHSYNSQFHCKKDEYYY